MTIPWPGLFMPWFWFDQKMEFIVVICLNELGCQTADDTW